MKVLTFYKETPAQCLLFFTSVLHSFSNRTGYVDSVTWWHRPSPACDPLMAGSASAQAGLLMAGPTSSPDGVWMPAVVSPNAVAPVETQMVAAPVGLLMAGGVSPNTDAAASDGHQMAAAPDGLQMAAALDGLPVSNSFLVDA
jgi:hypothetical protein